MRFVHLSALLAIAVPYEARGDADAHKKEAIVSQGPMQPSSQAIDTQPRAERVYYTTPLILAYSIPMVVTWAGVGIGLAYEDSGPGMILYGPVALSAFAGSIFAPSIVHWANRSPGKGFASLGGNVGMSFTGALMSLPFFKRQCDKRDEENPQGKDTSCKNFLLAPLLGATIGKAIWAFIDVTALGYTENATPTTAFVAPHISPLPSGGVTLGAIGAF